MDAITGRRSELLDKIVDTLLASGSADLSLRPLADSVGTSARMLIYHFDTKEKLIADALSLVRLRVERSLKALAAREKPASLRDFIFMFWNWATDKPNQRYFRLLFEVDGLSMYNRFKFSQASRRDGASVWIGLIDRAAAAASEDGTFFSAHSTLIIGAINGLLQDFLSTGDRKRTTTALSDLLDLVGQGGNKRPRKSSGKGRDS
jgi:AcrR family transcriptional regulator